MLLAIPTSTIEPDFGQWQRLKDRGYSDGDADLDAAVRKGFETQDYALISDALFRLWVTERLDSHINLVMDLYDQAKEPFKSIVRDETDHCVAVVERFACSRHGYQAYLRAVGRLCDESRALHGTGAINCLRHLCNFCGLDYEPYVMLALLRGRPAAGVSALCLLNIKKENYSISPELAYHIYMRFKDMEFFRRYKATYEEKAKAPFNSPSPPDPDSLAAIILKMKERIAADEKVMQEKYGNIEPGTYLPPRKSDGKSAYKRPEGDK
jgi:hypothetical protein